MFSDIIIIGGGAAGLLAAIAAGKTLREAGKGKEDVKVTVLEKMPRVGRKIMISGKGRCNFTNVKEWDEFSSHVRTKRNFLKPAFFEFGPADILSLLQDEAGLKCVVERGDRAFPASHKASDVVDALRNAAAKNGASILNGIEARQIVCNESASGPVFMISTEGTRTYSCHCLIVCTGGLSYPGTGSTGDGYSFAKSFGHPLVDTFPSLTAMVPRGYKNGEPDGEGHLHRSTPLTESGKELCSVHLRNITLSLVVDGKVIGEEFGEMDFTDGGIEGPVGFSLSRDAVAAIRRKAADVRYRLDLKSAITEEELTERISRLWKDALSQLGGQRKIAAAMDVLSKLLPKELVRPLRKAFPQILSDKVLQKRGLDCKGLCSALKEWDFPLVGYVGYERCVVTAGGVDTSEVNAKSMESRLQEGLFFAGEVLDIDCDTGGYNLQAAFSTGFLAGRSAARKLLQR